MADLSLAIFPEDTMAISITTTVLVGVWVVVFFNLRFGWVLSGLVVPGYLVPLLIAKPTSAGVILVESVITYAVVWWMSEGLKSRPYWSSLFGRDRFFVLVVASILVRTLMDGWVLPTIGSSLQSLLGSEFDHRNHFHSYGLIIVALMANGFWKPGLLRGSVPLGVTVGVTYLIVRYLLIETTNFNVGNLQYLYEDVASSLLASPKSYIILVTTAYIASRMSLRYAWDYNGILVPSLLALQWHEPLKILASFVEAFVVLFLARLVLKLPICRRMTIEGSRRILLFFNLAFLYRLALGYVIPVLLPTLKVTDTFGLGYLLSTLIAIRAHEKHLLVHVTRASLQVSLVGAVAGSLCGFALTFLPNVLPSDSNVLAKSDALVDPDGDLVTVLRRDQLTLFRQRVSDNYQPPIASDLKWFQEGLERLQEHQRTGEEDALSAARRALAKSNYSVLQIQQRYLYLRENIPTNGWGLYVLDMERPNSVIVEVPAPLDEWITFEAGLCIFQRLEGGGLAVAGASRHVRGNAATDVLTNPVSIYGTFHRQFERGNVLEVRGRSLGNARSHQTTRVNESNEPTSSLWIKNAIPVGCSLDRLRELLTGWQLHWQTTSLPNVLRDNTRRGFAELVLTRPDRRKLLANLMTGGARSEASSDVEIINKTVREWLLDRQDSIAKRGSDDYVPAQLEQLLYLDEQVIKPTLHLACRVKRYGDLPADEREELAAISAAASLLDYRLVVFSQPNRDSDCLGLVPSDGPLDRHWGAYVWRFGPRGSQVIEVPRPIYERNAYQFAATLFDRMNAAGLFVAGAHPGANVDGTADVIRLANKVNVFNLVHQVSLREWESQPLLVTSVRAIRAPVDAEIVLAMSNGTCSNEDASPLQQELLKTLQRDRLIMRFADGSEQIAGYEIGSVPQFTVMAQSDKKEFANLWLSPSVRKTYHQGMLESQFWTLGIPTKTADLYDHLCGCTGETQLEVPIAARRIVEQFVVNNDIVRLRKLQREFGQYQLTRFVDSSSRQTFLLIDQPHSNRLPAVASLAQPNERTSGTTMSGALQREFVEQFVNSRATWLEIKQP